MLIGISPLIGPDLLAILHRMGHGDELVLADAFFPGDTFNPRVVRADGVRIAPLLDGILSLINLDSYVDDPLVMMQPAKADILDPAMLRGYREAVDRHWPGSPAFTHIERFAFYDRCRKAFAVVLTGETTPYGNIIVKKGVIPVARP